MIEPLTSLIDRETGNVALTLFSLKMLRPAGPMGSGEIPFTLVSDAAPEVITLRRQMPVSEVTGGPIEMQQIGGIDIDSYWLWSAALLAPYGWSSSPTVFFHKPTVMSREQHLNQVCLMRLGEDQHDNFARMMATLRHDLGEPTSSNPGLKGIWPLQSPDATRESATWRFKWGTVELLHKQGKAQICVHWFL